MLGPIFCKSFKKEMQNFKNQQKIKILTCFQWGIQFLLGKIKIKTCFVPLVNFSLTF